MPDDMPSSWRYLNSASSRFSTVKSYMKRNNVNDNTQTQSWREWAGQKVRLRRGQSDDRALSTESISLFPGWATRRYGDVVGNEAFGIDVFVSGFATNQRSLEQASRSQRAFIRLAKGFASLPKLAADAIAPESASNTLTHLRASPSTEALLADIQLPPRPTDIPENYDVEVLERVFQRASAADDDSVLDSPSSSPTDDYTGAHADLNAGVNNYSVHPHAQAAAGILRRQHANLERRLQPFWSSVLPGRTVRLHLFALPSHPHEEQHPDHPAYDPIDSQDVVTAADGSFQVLFRVPWTDLCQHPGALHIAFGDQHEEHELLLNAQLLPLSSSAPSSSTSLLSVPPHSRAISPHRDRTPPRSPSATPSTLRISLTHSPIRVISDIDDTVKLSNILLGARAVFRSVFVKDLHETVIPGMGEWYTGMWSRGVRFHYVSNGPFEILPVINEFLQISKLPPGSIRLKSYAGRSIFNGILSAPATRKRAGVVDILTAFPDSRFFLIGDSGEQDLELYADLARDRPHQILAVLIRDADSTYDPIDDPTGWKAVGATGTRTDALLSTRSASADDGPRPRRTLSDFLGRSGASSSTAKATTLLSPPVVPFGGSSRNGNRGWPEYFAPARFTDEPESDTTPCTSPSPSPSPSVPQRTPSPCPKTKSPSAPMMPVPPMSPYNNTSNGGYGPRLTPSPSSAPSLVSRSSASSLGSRMSMSIPIPLASVSDAEKKRYGLQMRVYRARTQMPGHVFLRVFRHPGECVEVEEVLKEVGV